MAGTARLEVKEHGFKSEVRALREEHNKLIDNVIELEGSSVVDVASIAAGAEGQADITVTGAAIGDFVTAWSCNVSLAGLLATAEVQAADTVRVWLHNPTGVAIDLASATWRARTSSPTLASAAKINA